ncbi:MAG: PD-(D/E)XK nuclease-like domain-containing protein [Planctomycetes bacterium]|nr:PD-(D/E)XK nuclease-like domain-containing protein [Planctomycetota bacterium]
MNHAIIRWSKQQTNNTFINLEEMITEPDHVYQDKRADNLSSHALADYRDCPQKYYQKKQGIIGNPDSAAYAFGRAAHTRILEGEQIFTNNYVFGGPINEKTGKPYGEKTKKFAEWQEEQAKPVISLEHLDLIETMAEAVAGHSEAFALLNEGVAEKVARVDICDMPCQIRCDWMHPTKGLVDLKTCENLTWFENDLKRYGYIFQMAFYRAALNEFFGTDVDVHIIAVEKQAPHRVGVWHLIPSVLDHAEKINRAAMKALNRSQAKDFWPTGFEQVRQIDALS